MRVNRKVIFSLLSVGILACVASAGTYAYFQDTIKSTGNGVSTGNYIQLWVNGVRGSADGTVTISGNILKNIIPDPVVARGDGEYYVPDRLIKSFTVENQGSLDGKLYLQVIPRTETLGEGSNERIAIKAGLYGTPDTIYEDGFNSASAPKLITTLNHGQKKTINLYSNFPDTGENQNELQGKELKFDLVFILSTK